MSQLLRTENVLRIVVALLLSLLIWDAKGLCNRISALERNQVRIMVHLGIEPVSLFDGERLPSAPLASARPKKQ